MVEDGDGHCLGVSHGLVPPPVLVLNLNLKWGQQGACTHQTGQDVGAGSLEVKPSAIKGAVVGVSRSSTRSKGCW